MARYSESLIENLYKTTVRELLRYMVIEWFIWRG